MERVYGRYKKTWNYNCNGVAFMQWMWQKALPVEDYVSSNPAKVIYNAVMKTDTGYYYGSSEKKMSIHYYDVGSGQNIFCAAGRSVVIMEMHFVLQPVINTLLTQCVCMVESCI